MFKTFKYRIYPTKKQAEKLQWTLDRCRELYNAALQEKREAWKYARKSISAFDQMLSLTEIKRGIRPEYQEIGSHVLQDVIKRVDRAYKNFFRRVKRGEKPGFPRFQGRDRYNSFTYPDQQMWRFNLDKKGEKLVLFKIGHIKIKLHRPVQGKIKAVTIMREGDQWYTCFSCETEAQKKLPYTDLAVGLDLGLLHFATDSSGNTIENPRYLHKSEKKLEHLQKALSGKKRGSKRHKKAVKEIAKAHRKVKNQRRDFLHKESRILVDTYETIVFEDLAPANLSKRPKPKQDETGKYLPNGASAKSGLNKSIRDAGWGMFIQMCKYKAECAGVCVLEVNPKRTSQICSGCGQVRKKELSERWHSCECGTELDRDHNAAINILRLGQSLQATQDA